MENPESGCCRSGGTAIVTASAMSPLRFDFRALSTTPTAEGDNSDVLPTDTMKNTVYALAAREPVGELEAFGRRLGVHFLEQSPKLHRVRVDLSEHVWQRLRVDGHEAGSAFMRHGPDMRTASVQTDRRGSTFTAGVSELLILKSSHSAFEGYPRPIYTTLPETTDRLLATALTATWRYRSTDVAFGVSWETVRQILLDVFATHESRSVQHTLYAMGQAVVERVPDVGVDHPGDAEQASFAVRSLAARPRESQ